MPNNIAETIVAMERAALERWGQGDPGGFLAISDPSVTYFDPFVERRLDGLAGLTELYERLRGTIGIDEFEMVNPAVQRHGEMAVLSFQFHSRASFGTSRWNTTEVYRETPAGWRIIHSHWAFTGARPVTP
jgi:hypothetical protein